jgi:hypothetical protein
MRALVFALFLTGCLSAPSPSPDPEGPDAGYVEDGALVELPDGGLSDGDKGINEACEPGECAEGLACIGTRCYELCEVDEDCMVGSCEGVSPEHGSFCPTF